MKASLNNSVSKSTFCYDLVGLNGIGDFSEWFFYPGMMFGSYEKWWGKGGERPEPHEGLDICYYWNNAHELCRLEGAFNVPAMFDGVVYDISDDDFLGRSIFIRHDVRDSNSNILHSVYAHSNPVDGLCRNKHVKKGKIIAHAADIRDRKLSIPGHLHISMVYLPEDYPRDMLKWQILAISYQARLIDPIGFFECPYTVKNYIP